ncbi:MAG: (2E,6E)-farnesyl diphosphate synthase [Pyrinomonadaceae bacterium]
MKVSSDSINEEAKMMTSVSKNLDASAGEEVSQFFARCRELIDARLNEFIPSETTEPRELHAAIRWSMFAGGKRFRPALLMACGEVFNAPQTNLLATACAFEMIHTYSLIHDDLPAMDDDALRRGRPTCHVKFGEATAILAGDALNTLAFQIIAEDSSLDADVRVRLIAELAHSASTPGGMIAGQYFDLAAEKRDVGHISREELDAIHKRKTGALIASAAHSGAIIAGANEVDIRAVTNYAVHLGLLFQITDDVLDVTATTEELGKTSGKDERAGKATYPSLYGLEAAQLRARKIYGQACAALDEIKYPTNVLRAIATFILERRK